MPTPVVVVPAEFAAVTV
jgi:hypothetical protein